MTYGDLLRWGKDQFDEEERKYDVETLLVHSSELPRANLLAHLEDEASEVCEVHFKSGIEALKNDKPLQYILGYAYFDGRCFKVNEDVLIPRFDTEVLYHFALHCVKNGRKKVLDLCTGSGILAISLAKEGASVGASDISSKALDVAKENASIHQVTIDFREGDLFCVWEDEVFDLIVSNPPYIDDEGMNLLDNRVKKEPHLALYGGEDGLDYYRKIIAQAKNYLKNTGILALEIAYNQGHLVSGLFEEHGFMNIVVLKDHQGLDRVVLGSHLAV